jgi:hypothetical protein
MYGRRGSLKRSDERTSDGGESSLDVRRGTGWRICGEDIRRSSTHSRDDDMPRGLLQINHVPKYHFLKGIEAQRGVDCL